MQKELNERKIQTHKEKGRSLQERQGLGVVFDAESDFPLSLLARSRIGSPLLAPESPVPVGLLGR
jgi:hypothetical protein